LKTGYFLIKNHNCTNSLSFLCPHHPLPCLPLCLLFPCSIGPLKSSYGAWGSGVALLSPPVEYGAPLQTPQEEIDPTGGDYGTTADSLTGFQRSCGGGEDLVYFSAGNLCSSDFF